MNPDKPSFWPVFTRYARPHSRLIGVLVGLSVAGNVILVLQPALLAGILAAIVPGSPESAPAGSSWFDLDYVGPRATDALQRWLQTGNLLPVLVGLYLVVAVVSALLEYAAYLVALRIRTGATRHIQMDVLQQLLRLDLRFFHRRRSGELISRLQHNATNTAQGLGPLIMSFLQHSIQFVVFGAYLVSTSIPLAAAAFVLVLVHVGLSKSLKSPVATRGRTVYDRMADLTSRLQETFTGIRVIKSFGAERFERDRLQHAVDGVADSTYRLGKVEKFEAPARAVLSAVAVVGIFGIAAIELRAGRLSPTGLIMFVYLGRLLLTPAAGLATTYLWTTSFLTAYEPIAKILAEKPAVTDGTRSDVSFNDRLSLRGVSFSYGEGIPAVEQVNLEIRKSQVTALVGPSGAGKSTLTDLVLRLYDPDVGQILLDGVDIREFRDADYRRLFGVVSQENLLFHGTVRENIQYGRPSVGPAEIERAARTAHATHFISRLPEGYDTVVGDRGVKLSGGERQRIAIARAVAHDPKILILDEATSQLDSESEQHVQQAIDEMTKQTTAIMIAHRLSTIRKADQIVVMDQGRIVDTGRHEDLLARCGLYRQLCSLQFGVPADELAPRPLRPTGTAT